MATKSIFEPCSIGTLALKNRFVRSATGESRAGADGVLIEEVFPIYEALAAGGVGLIITGHAFVDANWKCSPKQTGVSGAEHVPGLRRLARASQGNGTKVVAQINHGARPPAEMTTDEIRHAADAFVAAGKRAVQAGFDGVQIHAAHGYLLSGFLTPSENLRTDDYGTDGEGRRRLLIEIASELRRALGPEYPILCKLGAVDGRGNSLPLEESIATAAALGEAGVDAIEVSAGFSGDHAQAAAEGIDEPEDEAYFAAPARAIRTAARIPVILVGGLRSLDVMQSQLDEGVCDLVSLCRPFIREPDLVNRLQSGQFPRAACISCNKCYNPDGFRCIFASE